MEVRPLEKRDGRRRDFLVVFQKVELAIPAYNECHEPSADVVQEKERANYCEYYQPSNKAGAKDKKAELLNRGYCIAQECTIPSSGVQLFYFSTENDSANFIFEVADLMEPNQYSRIQGIKSAYEGWNTETIAIEATT